MLNFNYVPDEDTTSIILRPTFAYFLVIFSSDSNAEGSPSSAAVLLDTNPSLLPNRTVHDGPLVCKPYRSCMLKNNIELRFCKSFDFASYITYLNFSCDNLFFIKSFVTQ